MKLYILGTYWKKSDSGNMTDYCNQSMELNLNGIIIMSDKGMSVM